MTNKSTLNSRQRADIARRIIPVYAANPHLKSAFVFGSVARGYADYHSDLEVGMVWSQPPLSEELETAALTAGAENRQVAPYDEKGRFWSEEFHVEALRVEIVHWTVETLEDVIAAVVDRHDVTQSGLLYEKQAVVSAIQKGLVLHGADLLEAWRGRLDHYPDELRIAMVRQNLRFSPFTTREMLAARNEIPLLYENHCHSVRLILNLLCGLNRIYHPSFKWSRFLVGEFALAPPNLFPRLENVFQADAISGMRELRLLIEETLSLVEEHLPQVDLREQRQLFTRPSESWPAPAAQEES